MPHRYHEDHIAAKGINSLSHYNLVRKSIPMPQVIKIPDAKAAVGNEWENWKRYTGMATDESQKQERCDQ